MHIYLSNNYKGFFNKFWSTPDTLVAIALQMSIIGFILNYFKLGFDEWMISCFVPIYFYHSHRLKALLAGSDYFKEVYGELAYYMQTGFSYASKWLLYGSIVLYIIQQKELLIGFKDTLWLHDEAAIDYLYWAGTILFKTLLVGAICPVIAQLLEKLRFYGIHIVRATGTAVDQYGGLSGLSVIGAIFMLFGAWLVIPMFSILIMGNLFVAPPL